MPEIQTVDPEVSRAKFDREVAAYRSLEEIFRARGQFLLEADFPIAYAVFAAARLNPPPLVVGVKIDFTNYDLRPPSVTFVNPLTREPVAKPQLMLQMLRRPTENSAAAPQGGWQPMEMIAAFPPDMKPFLCLPGVREYHDSPAHSGDPWLLHRGSDEGTLAFILEKIWAHGTATIAAFQTTITMQAPAAAMAVDIAMVPT